MVLQSIKHITETNTMKLVTRSALCLLVLGASNAALAATELVIATVNNGHMVEMQKLGKFFEKANPEIKLKWVTLDENDLRQRVTADIEAKNGQFDVVTIGMYETPIWGKRGWLVEFKPDANYEIEDLLPRIRVGLSADDKLYAAPFYGESSMIMYREDLVAKAGMKIYDRPTWDHIRKVAAKIHNPANGVYGICLRGKPGWGDNMALISTMVNTFGGQWFDMKWQPQLTSQPWKNAINFYVDLLKDYGPPDSSANSFNEILALFNQGKCGIWIDATIAASFITDPKKSKVADKVGFAQSPVAESERGASWLWAWALAIPKSSRKVDAAQKFINWGTSRAYIELVGKESGWSSVPTGTRKSTYGNKGFRQVTRYGSAELKAIYSADPKRSTQPKSPYLGVQFAAIPEFQSIGNIVGQELSSALAGSVSVDKALEASQLAAEREMRKGGYFK